MVMVRDQKIIKTLSFILLAAMLLPDLAFASEKTLGNTIAEELKSKLDTSVSEYYFRTDRDDLLMPVYVLGSVSKPGIYHVPIHTDLITLLAITGGATATADLTDINVKNQDAKTVSTIDLEKEIAEKNARAISLRGNDVIFIQEKKPFFSAGFVTGLTIFGTILGTVLTYYFVRQQVRTN